jgi:hypothetical protein
MTATPGVLPAWPRRRRYAGFARGSASGGAVPIMIGSAHKAALCRELLIRSSALPGVRVLADDDGAVASVLGATDAIVRVRVTRTADLIVQLPGPERAALRAQGWIASETSTTALLHGPRTPDEREVVWRVIALVCAPAAAAPGDALPDIELTHAPGTLAPPASPAGMESAAPI